MSDIIVAPSGDSGTNGWIIALMLVVFIIGGISLGVMNHWWNVPSNTTINVTTPPAAGARQTEINLSSPTPDAEIDTGIVDLPTPEPERPSADVPVDPEPAPDPDMPAPPEPAFP